MHGHDENPAGQWTKADYFILLIIVGFFVARVVTLPHRLFDPDEFQHSHAAWCLFKGMLPYRDFFEHHTPWYYFALSPFFRWFDVAGSFASARHFLSYARGLSLALTVVSVAFVVLIGGLWNRRLGLLAGLFFAVQPVVMQKTLEIRPDVLALPGFLAALWLLLRGMAASEAGAGKALRSFAGAGLCLGGALMCTQKMLFALPGLLAGVGLWTLVSSGAAAGDGRSRRLVLGVALLGGMALPPALTWLGFAARHGGTQFIANNFLLNSRWTHVAPEQLIRVLQGSWPVLLLAVGGVGLCLRPGARDSRLLVLLCTLVGLSAGIPVVPVAHRQYYLMPVPIACLFAAQALLALVDLAQRRARSSVLVLATLPLLVLPALDVWDALHDRNDQQLARLRYVFDHTAPTDVVMDGWEGTGVFRPHALPHYFIHDEMLAMLSPAQVDAYVDALEQGTIRPRLIALDEHLVALGSRFLRFVYRNYRTSDGFFYLRK